MEAIPKNIYGHIPAPLAPPLPIRKMSISLRLFFKDGLFFYSDGRTRWMLYFLGSYLTQSSWLAHRVGMRGLQSIPVFNRTLSWHFLNKSIQLVPQKVVSLKHFQWNLRVLNWILNRPMSTMSRAVRFNACKICKFSQRRRSLRT